MALTKPCPHCGKPIVTYRNPVPTVDILVHIPGRGVVLIQRKNEPLGWALPGGFVDYGESVETAAKREAKEEIGLDVELTGIVGVYSDPHRDPRQHTMSVVFTAQAADYSALQAGDDAGGLQVFPIDQWPSPLCFDHARILDDYVRRFQRLNRS